MSRDVKDTIFCLPTGGSCDCDVDLLSIPGYRALSAACVHRMVSSPGCLGVGRPLNVRYQDGLRRVKDDMQDATAAGTFQKALSTIGNFKPTQPA